VHKTDHLLPYTAAVKSEWSCNSTPPPTFTAHAVKALYVHCICLSVMCCKHMNQDTMVLLSLHKITNYNRHTLFTLCCDRKKKINGFIQTFKLLQLVLIR
jgi:hypothetical protein